MRSIARYTVVLVMLAMAVSAVGQSQQPPLRSPDVIFVPTVQSVVDEMLGLAKVSSNSMVYDLGCGDGRLVITAAQRFGARGIGIDIDPQRIRESNENAAKAKVTDRVKFILGDLFAADFHDATAVTLYLLPELNVKLRPILFQQLKPGTPVVSHDFDMGDWQPDVALAVKAEDRDHGVYLWIIPASVAGIWKWNVSEGGAIGSYELHLQQQFQKVTGKLIRNGEESSLNKITLKGTQLSFDTAYLHYEATVDGNRMQVGATQNGQPLGPWTASRAQMAETK